MPAHHDVHVVWRDVVEKPLVMSDEQHRVVRLAQPVHSFRHVAKRVDVQPRVNLVQDRQVSFEDLEPTRALEVLKWFFVVAITRFRTDCVEIYNMTLTSMWFRY